MNIRKQFAESAASTLDYASKAAAYSIKYGDSVASTLEPLVDHIISVSVDGAGFNVSVSGDRHILYDTFKALADGGWHTTSKRPQDNDPTWCGVFRLESVDYPAIWLYFTSTVCKRVKVGTQLVEQDVYEIQCGEPE